MNAALTRLLIADALTRLSDEHRAVVRRSYYLGWTTAQIARDLHIAECTVKSRPHFALRALRFTLQRQLTHRAVDAPGWQRLWDGVRSRHMTVLEALAESVGQTGESIGMPAVLHEFRLEPRCRICRNDHVRKKVNDMLAAGLSYTIILRALRKENGKLDKRQQVTIDSIRNHTARHFPVQNVAKATYRQILERRAQENGVDFVNGVAMAITPMAFFETVMAKGYETLVDPDTKVDVNTGMIVAGRLQALIESRASGTSMVGMLVKMDRIIDAIRSTVPAPM